MLARTQDLMYLHSPDHLAQILAHLAGESRGRDVVVQAVEGGGSGEVVSSSYFLCHRIVLAAFSGFFRKVLNSLDPEEPALILMSGYSREEVEELISFLYQEKSELHSQPAARLLTSKNEGGCGDERVPSLLLHHRRELDREITQFQEFACVKMETPVEEEEEEDEVELSPEITSNFRSSELVELGERSHHLSTVASQLGKTDGFKPIKQKRKKDWRTIQTNYSENVLTAETNSDKLQPARGRRRVAKSRVAKYPIQCPSCLTSLASRKERNLHVCPTSRSEQSEGFGVEDERLAADPLHLPAGGGGGGGGPGVGVASIICHRCGVKLSDRGALSLHVKLNCENVCQMCKAVFSSRTDLKTHMFESHHKVLRRRSFQKTFLEKQFPCSDCDKRFSKANNLQLHIDQAHHDGSQVKFQCQDCGKLLSTKHALKKHVTLHKPPGHSCPICGKLFHNACYLSRHAISQHGEQQDKKHRCDMCDKGFNNKMALDGHRNWHLNLKPYQCRWCERKYQNTSNCAAHERKTHRELYETSLRNGNRMFQTRVQQLDTLLTC